ncbi:hypothetical protein OH687_10760 [Burkholderia anthina]|nr:hypothetical protein OH687_10760 [Burkholderia anthina]
MRESGGPARLSGDSGGGRRVKSFALRRALDYIVRRSRARIARDPARHETGRVRPAAVRPGWPASRVRRPPARAASLVSPWKTPAVPPVRARAGCFWGYPAVLCTAVPK